MTTQTVTPSRTLVLVWIALLVLLLITFGSSFFPLGYLNVTINVAVAVAKALLVLAFFMNLRQSTHLTRIFAAAGFFWIMLLIALSVADYLTRPMPPSPG